MLPAPTTTSPARSACLIATRRPRNPVCRCVPVNSGSNGSSPSPASSRAAIPVSSAGDHSTAPKRRGSVRRSVPRVVARSKWSCGPGAGAAGEKRQRAGHAQVQQQAAAVEWHPQVLSAAHDLAHALRDQMSGLASERPAQGLAEAHGRDLRPANAGARSSNASIPPREVRAWRELSRAARIAPRTPRTRIDFAVAWSRRDARHFPSDPRGQACSAFC